MNFQQFLSALILIFLPFFAVVEPAQAKPTCASYLEKDSRRATLIDRATDAGLTMADLEKPGIRRTTVVRGDEISFVYSDSNHHVIKNQKEIERLNALGVPPAYENTWYSSKSSDHIQATAIDARGRTQYYYHPKWVELRDQLKFERMSAFGEALPAIRRTIDREQSHLALAVQLLEKTLIRIGSEEYAEDNQTFGLTTLRKRHVRVEGDTVYFSFVGKSSKRHRIQLEDADLAKRVSRLLMETRGQTLFGDITAEHVNEYLKEISGADISAKDFRTWFGSLVALQTLHELPAPKNEKDAKTTIREAMKVVAEKLGNTPAVARSSYVYPEIIAAFTDGKTLTRIYDQARKQPGARGLSLDERALLFILN